MLKIEHLTKTYGGKPAVQDLCLHIRPGELCAFIGHNGAGKTTTLKCCCGIQQFDAGEIYVDGISVRENHWNASAAWPICRMTRSCTSI